MGVDRVTPEPVIRLLQSLLEGQGDVGRWLLERIDEALEAGVEDDLGDGQQAWADLSLDQPITGLVFRAPANGWEILDVYLAVLEAYLAELPACIDSTMHALEHHQVQGATVTLRSDRVTDDLGGQVPRSIPLANLAAHGWQEKWSALQHIRQLVRDVPR